MSRSVHRNLAFTLCILALCSGGCSDETTSESPRIEVGEAAPPSHLRIQRLSLENTSFEGQRGAGYADMYEAKAYAGEDASKNAGRLDFRHQYRGRDIGNQRSFENMTTKTRWDSLGLFTDVTPTESSVTTTSLDEATFDGIGNDVELVHSFDFETMRQGPRERYRRAYLANANDEPTARVFAFIDKDGRRGLFKVSSAETAPVDTVSKGAITIEIKIEDPPQEPD